jgi:hypothetical protein
VREWVKGRAIEIKDCGRVLVAVIQQYKATAGAYKPERPCEIGAGSHGKPPPSTPGQSRAAKSADMYAV